MNGMLVECPRCGGDGFLIDEDHNYEEVCCTKCRGLKHIEETQKMRIARQKRRVNVDKALRALQSALAVDPALSEKDLQDLQYHLKRAHAVLEWQPLPRYNRDKK